MKRTFFAVGLLSIFLIPNLAQALRKETQLLGAVAAGSYVVEKLNLLDKVPSIILDPVDDFCDFLGLKGGPQDILRFVRATSGAMVVTPEGAGNDNFLNISDVRGQVRTNALVALSAAVAAKKLLPEATAARLPEAVEGAAWAALLTAGHTRFPQVAQNVTAVSATGRAFVDGALERTIRLIGAFRPYQITNNVNGVPAAPVDAAPVDAAPVVD